MNRLPDPPLLLVTDRRQARRPLPEVLAPAFAAGCRWASLREKDLPEAEQLGLLRSLLPVAERWGARLTLHGDAVLAREAGAHGVHLPAGANPASARALLGKDALIGLSVHRLDELGAAGMDYVIAGPVYETASKPGYGPQLGPAGLAAIVARSPVPVLGIGGIAAGTAPEVMVSGAAGIAVMGEVMRADDPGTVVAGLLEALNQPRPR